MAANDTHPRCSGCGKPLDEGKTSSRVMRIAQGKMKNGVYVEGKEWGVLHEACFHRSIDSPDAVLDEVRRQAREPRSAA